MRASVILSLVIALAGGAGAGFYYRDDVRRWFDPWQVDLCDRLIMAGLRSPATYQRVDVLRMASEVYIHFDAANALGVPIRGLGRCVLPDTVNLLVGATPTVSIDGQDVSPIIAQTVALDYWMHHH